MSDAPVVKMAKGLPWFRIALTLLFFLFVPASVFCIWLARGNSLSGLHVCVAGGYLLMSVVMLLQTALALPRRRCELPAADISATLIVAAYLPNEQDLIMETLRHMLRKVERPRSGFQLILAYNTPEPMAIEAELRELSRRHPEFTALRVHGSKSKAENVNFALKFAAGRMIAVFDADHQPAPDCLARASRWIAAGYDMVQGRSVVRDPGNWHARIVAAEFETIYGIGHSAASLMAGGGMFCGSNGYWRAEALISHNLDASMLTEDIDLSIRAALAGRRMVHDRSIVSTELATTNLKALWAQRSRWARGWLEVTLRHQLAVLRSPRISLAQKAYFTLLLGVREVYNHASFLIFPLLLAYAATGGAQEHNHDAFMWSSAIVTFATGPLIALAAARHSRHEYGWRTWAGYMSVIWLYAALKSLISLVAALDCAMARRAEWVVTPRSVVVATPFPAALTDSRVHGIRAAHARRKMPGRARPPRPLRASVVSS